MILYERVNEQYFCWMTDLVCDNRYTKRKSWRKLFSLLHRTEFTYILDMDANRAADGSELRRRFAYEFEYSDSTIHICLDDRPCSVLEVMVALAHRCEEQIMDDPDSGNRTGKWFFEMIDSLGLSDMDDRYFNEQTACAILDRFLERGYRPDGRGGLFTVRAFPYDMRDMGIWQQMHAYLNEVMYGGEEI